MKTGVFLYRDQEESYDESYDEGLTPLVLLSAKYNRHSNMTIIHKLDINSTSILPILHRCPVSSTLLHNDDRTVKISSVIRRPWLKPTPVSQSTLMKVNKIIR
ncbi:MAG: hypothetical protein KDE47_28630, partial [Caldilineaceae bacterium]|nr:hypothetical protein [Caldilineaceae bacterium]